MTASSEPVVSTLTRLAIARALISLAVLGQGSGTNATLAWIYFASRVVHSLVQATFNKIEVRFAIFFLSSLVLIALTINAVRAAF
jgi:hypothetical protein